MADGYKIGENLRQKLAQMMRRGDIVSLPKRTRRMPEGFYPATIRPPNSALVVNASEKDVPLLGVLSIIGALDAPSSPDVEENDEFVWSPVLVGFDPGPDTVATVSHIAIALEEVKSYEIGRFAFAGVMTCKVKILDQSHRYARGRVGDVTQLVSASCGPVKLVYKEAGTGDDKWAVGVL